MRQRTLSSKAELLRNLSLFRTCTAKELETAAQSVDEATLPAGAVLTREGRPGGECFVIRRGSASVRLNGETIAVVGPGDVVGEMALLDGALRAATVTADTALDVVVMTRQGLDRLLIETPVARTMLQALAQRLRETTSVPSW